MSELRPHAMVPDKKIVRSDKTSSLSRTLIITTKEK
jgi:hypothetical protein